jgi:hypothetical protein
MAKRITIYLTDKDEETLVSLKLRYPAHDHSKLIRAALERMIAQEDVVSTREQVEDVSCDQHL